MNNYLQRLEITILKTPTGELRNRLCDIRTHIDSKQRNLVHAED